MGCGASQNHPPPDGTAPASAPAPTTGPLAWTGPPPAAATAEAPKVEKVEPATASQVPLSPKAVTATPKAAAPIPLSAAAESKPVTTPAATPTAVKPTPSGGAAVSSTSVPPPPPLPLGSTATSNSNPALFADMSLVYISGIAAKPEFNGQVGLILSYEGGEARRYTVKVLGQTAKLKEEKLSIAPAGSQLSRDPNEGIGDAEGDYVDSVIDSLTGGAPAPGGMGFRDKSTTSLGSTASLRPTEKDLAKERQNAALQEEARRRNQANDDAIKRMPVGELTANGRLLPTYHWVQVPPIASLPPGMEVWMPVGGLKCARIPSTWRLQVVAEGQVDSFRTDVEEHTPVIDVIIGAASAFGWEVQDIELRGEGKPMQLDEEATVGNAGLFGRKLTARHLT